jgi:hypothetical protein
VAGLGRAFRFSPVNRHHDGAANDSKQPTQN